MGKALAVMVIVFVILCGVPIASSSAQASFNVEITPGIIDRGIMQPGVSGNGTFRLINHDSNDAKVEIHVIRSNPNITIDFPESVDLNPLEEKTVSIKFVTPSNPGEYVIKVKFRPATVNEGSGGGAVPEFEAKILFSVPGIKVNIFHVDSGEPNEDLLMYLEVSSYNLTFTSFEGKVEFSQGGNVVSTMAIKKNAGNETNQLNWSRLIQFDQEGAYVGILNLKVNSTKGVIPVGERVLFIVGRSIPFISVKVNDNSSEIFSLEIIADNNGTLPYLLSLGIEIRDSDTGELALSESIADVVERRTSYIIPVVVPKEGTYDAIITGSAGGKPIAKIIKLGQVAQTIIGKEPPSNAIPPVFLLAGTIAVIGVLGLSLLLKIRHKKVSIVNSIIALHSFTESGEGLFTYDMQNKEIDEMDFNRLGKIVLAINSVEVPDSKFISVKFDDQSKLFVTLINGLGFAVEVPVKMTIDEVESSGILHGLRKIEEDRGNKLKNGLVDVSADYLEYLIGETE